MPPVCPAPTHLYLRVGYGWNESTNLACAVGDLASSLDLTVQVVTSAEREQGVHDRWDARVLYWDRNAAPPRTSMALWFEPDKAELVISKRKGIRNVLVARSASQAQAMRELTEFCSDVVVCEPDFVPHFVSTQKSRCIPNHCCLVEPYRDAMPRPDSCVWIVDSRTLRKHGYGVMHTLQLLLDFNRQLRVTLVCQGTCDSATNSVLGELLRKHPERLQVVRRASRQLRQTLYRECGWAVVLTCGDGGATYLLEGLYAGLGVAAFDYGGAREVFQSVAGWPIACGIEYNSLGLPQATIDHAGLITAIQACYAQAQARQESAALRLKSRLRERRLRFEAGWRELWNLH